MNYRPVSIIKYSTQLIALLVSLVVANELMAKNFSIPSLPEPHIISGAHASWIARQILHNDVPMNIIQFTYPGPAKEVADHYKEYLSGKPALIELENNKLSVIYEESGNIISVQIFNSGAHFSEGKIITSKIPDKSPTPLRTDIPLMCGSTIISKTQSIDGSVNSETLMISNYHSRETNYRYFEQQLLKNGWQIGQANITRTIDASQQISFVQGSKKLQITLFPLQKNTNGNTGILIHLLK